MAPAEPLHVELVYSPAAGKVERWAMTLPAGSTVADAIRASGVLAACPDLTLESASVGVWGALKPLDHPLRERDRVELYRPLKVDPKEARRQRHRSHRLRPR